MLELLCDWYAVIDGTYIIDNAYVSIEYKPTMARAYTHTRNNKAVEWAGILLSKYVSLRCGIESSFISGRLYCSYSLWVGIRVFNTRCSYGGLNVWSIWTMPAILRIFVYQTDASPYNIRPYAFFGSVVGWGHRGQDRADAALEQYVLLTVLVIQSV